jgi:dimeric dUTPase (all-alpha-NTP-PPase superfamily)
VVQLAGYFLISYLLGSIMTGYYIVKILGKKTSAPFSLDKKLCPVEEHLPIRRSDFVRSGFYEKCFEKKITFDIRRETMNLEKLFTMQKGLDHHIETQHQLTNEDLFDRKVLALLVELGELANETRCFKFWSVKPPSKKDIILEEFVDGIHFILSLGIECGFAEQVNIDSSQLEPTNSLTEQFLQIYQLVCEFRTKRSRETYEALFRAYLHLAALLGFTNVEIEQAYIRKNEVNYQRQQQGY